MHASPFGRGENISQQRKTAVGENTTGALPLRLSKRNTFLSLEEKEGGRR